MTFIDPGDQELPVVLPPAADEAVLKLTFHFEPSTLEVVLPPPVFHDFTVSGTGEAEPLTNSLRLLMSDDWDELIGRAAELAAQEHPRELRGDLLLARLQVIILRRVAALPRQEQGCYALSHVPRGLVKAETLKATL